MSEPYQTFLPTSRFVKVQTIGDSPSYITKGTFSKGADISLSVTTDNKPYDQLFQLTEDGHILSQISNKVFDVTDNKIVLKKWSNDKSQIWEYDADKNTIKNVKNKSYISINKNTKELVLSNNGEKWYFGPTYPFQKILKEKESFPSFVGEQLEVFKKISERACSSDDIRRYYNTKSVSSYPGLLNGIQFPGIQESVSRPVLDQINKELAMVLSVDTLFSSYLEFHQNLFSNDQATLIEMEKVVGLEHGSTSEYAFGWILTLITGVVATAIDLIPEVGPALANILQVSVNVGVEVYESLKTTQINIDPFQVTLYYLWNTLLTSFNGILTTNSEMNNAIVTDWGKLQSAYKYIQIQSGPSSLCWYLNTASKLLKPANSAYRISLLQMLISAKFQIYVAADGDVDGKVPDYCKWKKGKSVYYIAGKDSNDTFPSSELMENELWKDNKVTREDFFLLRNGWNLPVSQLLSSYIEKTSSTITVSNNSSTPMKINLDKHNVNGNIHAYSSFTYIAEDEDKKIDDNTIVTIKDYNNNTISTFKVATTDGLLYIKDVEGKEMDADGYKLGHINSNKARFSYAKSINIPIYVVPKKGSAPDAAHKN